MYVPGHAALAPLGRAKAALLAAGERAVLSHVSAALVWGILPGPAADDEVHVTIVGLGRLSRPGLLMHRTAALHRADVRRIEGLLVTAPARTLLDLAAIRDLRLEAAASEAHAKRLLSAGEPMPEMNARLEHLEVDAVWRAQRLALEVDSFAYHGHRAAFERDRAKTMALERAGWRVLRVTSTQLKDEPFVVVAHLARMLERGLTADPARPLSSRFQG